MAEYRVWDWFCALNGGVASPEERARALGLMTSSDNLVAAVTAVATAAVATAAAATAAVATAAVPAAPAAPATARRFSEGAERGGGGAQGMRLTGPEAAFSLVPSPFVHVWACFVKNTAVPAYPFFTVEQDHSEA